MVEPDDYVIYAIDPGKVTGVACYDPEISPTPEFWMTEDWIGLVEHLQCSPVDHIVIERFTINNRTAQRAPDGLPLRITGAIEYIADYEGYNVIFQPPSKVMRIITDDVLKSLGWYTPGPDHANDAARHLAVYALESTVAAELKVRVEEALRSGLR